MLNIHLIWPVLNLSVDEILIYCCFFRAFELCYIVKGLLVVCKSYYYAESHWQDINMKIFFFLFVLIYLKIQILMWKDKPLRTICTILSGHDYLRPERHVVADCWYMKSLTFWWDKIFLWVWFLGYYKTLWQCQNLQFRRQKWLSKK